MKNIKRKMVESQPVRQFRDWEIASVALFLQGGGTTRVYTEHVAIQLKSMASDRFRWRFYPDEINLELVRRALSRGSTEKAGVLILGSHRAGWILSSAGLLFAKDAAGQMSHPNALHSRNRIAQLHKERDRILGSKAWKRYVQDPTEEMGQADAMELLKLTPYVVGAPRLRKVQALIGLFSDDMLVLPALEIASKRLGETK